MRLLLTGARGQLGTDFLQLYGDLYQILAIDRDVDIRNEAEVRRCVLNFKPHMILHTAAFTAVDRAESDVEEAFAVNAVGSRNLARAASEVNGWMIAISSDYVFPGDDPRPRHEFDSVAPVNIYGQSKLAGEREVSAHCPQHTIVRTAWLYGFGENNFPSTMLRKAAAWRPHALPLRVVNDQTGNPTSTTALAQLLVKLIDDPIPGIVHGSCEGTATWYELTRTLFRIAKIEVPVEPCSTDEFPRPARRPPFSALDKMMLRIAKRDPMPRWEEALHRWYECYENH